jgi:N-acetylglucosamine-6-phosphate deacetylase
MQFETIDGRDLAAPVLDVVQEAIDATATTYTRSPEIDVDHALHQELRSRGVRASSDATVEEIAHAIRSGHHVALGEHDGSVG